MDGSAQSGVTVLTQVTVIGLQDPPETASVNRASLMTLSVSRVSCKHVFKLLNLFYRLLLTH